MNPLEATRAWVRGCPLIDRNNKFNANYLGTQATEYSLSTASDSHRSDVCGYDHAVYNMIFSARMVYGAMIQQNLLAADFFANLSQWIRDKDRAQEYPQVTGYSVTKITAANAGLIIAAEANTAEYNLQIQMILEED